MGESGNGLHLSGIVLAVLVLAAWMLQEPPLAPSRPSHGDQLRDSGNSFEDVPARLWQDPFDSVQRFRARQREEQRAQAPSPGQTDIDFQHGRVWLEDYLKQTLKDEDDLTILPVMTNTSSYAEASEHRLRLRTAVIAALGNNDIAPMDGSHMGYWFYEKNDNNTPTAIIPYELYRGRHRAVLVLWLPVEHFDRDPILRLADVIGDLRQMVADIWSEDHKPKSHRFTLIGPPDSGTLVNMARDAAVSAKQSALDKVEVFSATATAPACTLLDDDEAFECRLRQYALETMFAHQGMNLIRSILTDQHIAKAMVKELALRGVDLACRENPTYPHPHCREDASDRYYGHRDHVVLISEADTHFGRSLPRLFNSAVIENMKEEEGDKFQGLDLPWIHRFGYLRGLDGELPNNGQKLKTSSPTSLEGLSQLDQAGLEPAVGTSQFDYLRRLAVHIKRMDQVLRNNGQGRIRAIGIMGNDVYDKLLILQAMREYFPDLLYFTNDLDARFLNPKDYRWTRNLVVASSFGLQLQPDLQGRVPPLRGVYQTSMFLSTQLALALKEQYRNSKSLQTLLAARIFEVGRGRFIDLGFSNNPVPGGKLEVADKTLENLYPPPYQAPHLPPHLWLIGLILLLALLLLGLLVSPLRAWLRRHCRKKQLFMLALWLVAGAALIGEGYFWMTARQEPFVWASGVSIWPSELIHIFCFMLAVLFLVLAVSRVEHEEKRLAGVFHLSPGELQDPQPVRQPRHGALKRFRPVLDMLAWYDEPADEDDKEPILELWQTYTIYSRQSHRFVRAGLIVVILWVIAWTALVYVQPMQLPYRGATAYYFSFWFGMVPLAISFGLLLFWVMDETRLCSALIRHICHSDQDWPKVEDDIREQLKREQAAGTDTAPVGSSVTQTSTDASPVPVPAYRIELECKRRTMDFIAQRTAVAGDMIWYPFIVLILILISLSTRFDNYDTEAAVVSLLFIALAIALSSAYVLRRTARNVKKRILEQLHKNRLSQQSVKAKSEPEQVEVLIKQIEGIQQGAFRPWYQEPLVRALAWLGSMAAVIITEYLTVSG